MKRKCYFFANDNDYNMFTSFLKEVTQADREERGGQSRRLQAGADPPWGRRYGFQPQ